MRGGGAGGSHLASSRALQDVEQTILGSLKTYSETVTAKMNELVALNLPSEGELQAAQTVREEVLNMTVELIRSLQASLPNKPGRHD
jgi:hypothetical protein